MAKKSSRSTKYKHFHLHGDYTNQRVLVYIFLDLSIGFVLGFMLQPLIVETLTSYAASVSGY